MAIDRWILFTSLYGGGGVYVRATKTQFFFYWPDPLKRKSSQKHLSDLSYTENRVTELGVNGCGTRISNTYIYIYYIVIIYIIIIGTKIYHSYKIGTLLQHTRTGIIIIITTKYNNKNKHNRYIILCVCASARAWYLRRRRSHRVPLPIARRRSLAASHRHRLTSYVPNSWDSWARKAEFLQGRHPSSRRLVLASSSARRPCAPPHH